MYHARQRRAVGAWRLARRLVTRASHSVFRDGSRRPPALVGLQAVCTDQPGLTAMERHCGDIRQSTGRDRPQPIVCGQSDRYAKGRGCGRLGEQVTPCADAWVTKRLRYKVWRNTTSDYPRFRVLAKITNYAAALFWRSESHASGDRFSVWNVGKVAENDEGRSHKPANAQTVINSRCRRWARSAIRHASCS